MRRITKYAAITLGAAAATFMVVSNLASSPLASTPTAKATTFCPPEDDVTDSAIIPVPVDITLPSIPNLADIIGSIQVPEIPCIPLPTLENLPPLPGIPELPTGNLPNLQEILGNIQIPELPDVVIPYPNFFPTTTTTDPCQDFSVADGLGSAAC